jgi:hypothetical protein
MTTASDSSTLSETPSPDISSTAPNHVAGPLSHSHINETARCLLHRCPRVDCPVPVHFYGTTFRNNAEWLQYENLLTNDDRYYKILDKLANNSCQLRWPDQGILELGSSPVNTFRSPGLTPTTIPTDSSFMPIWVDTPKLRQAYWRAIRTFQYGSEPEGWKLDADSFYCSMRDGSSSKQDGHRYEESATRFAEKLARRETETAVMYGKMGREPGPKCWIRTSRNDKNEEERAMKLSVKFSPTRSNGLSDTPPSRKQVPLRPRRIITVEPSPHSSRLNTPQSAVPRPVELHQHDSGEIRESPLSYVPTPTQGSQISVDNRTPTRARRCRSSSLKQANFHSSLTPNDACSRGSGAHIVLPVSMAQGRLLLHVAATMSARNKKSNTQVINLILLTISPRSSRCSIG